MFSTLIDSENLAAELDNPDWLICDCRYDLMDKSAGKKAYLESHIPGAVYLDVHDDLSGPPVTNKGRHPLPTDKAMQTLFSRLGIKAETQVVVYDNASGSFAARLWWMLRHMQHDRVALLDGGWQRWQEQARPTSTAAASPAAVEFTQTALTDDLVVYEEVTNHACLVDSRDPERYRGEIEPIDRIAGHIPGAVNRCWKDNLQTDGRFKPQAELEQEFKQLFGSRAAEETVFYCGSGVTACHNLLAVCHAGLKQPMLYAGSWSEWCNMPESPIATGE